MPWKISSHDARCSGFAVLKESDGSVAGCHDTREQAEAQLRALYANEPNMSGSVDHACSCQKSPTETSDPFGEAYAASVLMAVREPNRAARRAARAGRRARRALQAAAMHDLDEPFPVPAYPPREWFQGPPSWVAPWRAAAGLRPADDGGILRLTITDEGQVGGWFFNAGQCLVHDPTACPKHSPTRYAAFHQSDQLCADGTMLDVGVIGMTHGHQSPWLDWKEAQRLYADPTAQKIICVAGDDERGGWIAGAVVPGCTYGDIAMMRRSGLSGDWRPMPQSWWDDHGISRSEVRQVEGYDCIGPTLVTRPALPLVRNFSINGRAAAILGGSAGVELSRSRFDYCRPHITATSRFARAAAPPGNPEALRQWYNDGADGQITWGEHGDFDACVAIASDHMDADQAKGFCAERHNDVLGEYPGSKTAHGSVSRFAASGHWDEEEHPRDESGKFDESGGGQASKPDEKPTSSPSPARTTPTPAPAPSPQAPPVAQRLPEPAAPAAKERAPASPGGGSDGKAAREAERKAKTEAHKTERAKEQQRKETIDSLKQLTGANLPPDAPLDEVLAMSKELLDALVASKQGKGPAFDSPEFNAAREQIRARFAAMGWLSRFARRAYTEWDPEAHPRGEAGRFVTSGGPAEGEDAGIVKLHSTAAPGEVDTAMADMRDEAAQIMQRAAKADKTVTPAMQDLVAQVDTGAKLVGLDFRLKENEDRIAQKLAEAHQKGLDDAAAIDSVADALRYTIQQDPDKYTNTYTMTRDGLIAAGYTPVPGKEKNFWDEGDAYQGMNTQWRSPEGMKFELQFHTPDSARTVQEIHKTFETWRTTDDPQARQSAFDEMVAKWADVEVPPGILEHGELQATGRARAAALDSPIRYFRTGQGKVFRERHEDGGMYLEPQLDDGSWGPHDGDLLAYRIGMDTDFDEIPEPPIQTAVSRFARRAYAEFREEEHPRGEGGRFVYAGPREDYGGINPVRHPRLDVHATEKERADARRSLERKAHGRFDFGEGTQHPIERVSPVTLPNRVSLYPDNVQSIIDANPRMSGEEDFVYQGRIVAGLDAESQSDVIDAMRETYEPVGYIAQGLDQWVSDHGLDPLPDGILTMLADPVEADAVARYFETTPDQSQDPGVRAAYEDFKSQNAEMYDYMTRPESEGGLGITVDYTDKRDPYRTAEAQAEDLAQNRHITIERGLGGDHPLLTPDEYDQFRAVHDVFGHAAIGGGFDRHGEYEAWLTHAAMYTDPGRQAMSTEYHGVNSAAWSGEPGTPGTGKALLLPNEYGTPPWDRTGQQEPAMAAAAEPSKDAVIQKFIKALGLQPGFAQAFDHPAWHVDEAVQAGVSDLKGPLGAEAKPRKVDPNRTRPLRTSVSRFARRAYVFNEEDHPRDTSGRFTEGTGESTSGGPSGEGSSLADKFIAGQKVVLPIDEVATFTDRMADFLKQEKAEGRQTNLNLCEVSVPGTNLFCGDNQGFSRMEMPQLIGVPTPGSPADALPKDEGGAVDIQKAFVDSLRAQGISTENDVVPSASLKATQDELRGDKSISIANAIRDGKVDIEGGERIVVSKDNYILDGHHRWAGAVLNDAEDGHLGDSHMPIERVDLGILDLVKMANDFAAAQGVAPKGLTGPAENDLVGLTPRAAAAATKTEGGQSFRSSDYAYVEDPDQPSTWKLRLTASPGGAPDAGMVGRAIAAFGAGYRGNKVSLPRDARDKVAAKLRGAWKRANPDKSEKEMPSAIRAAASATVRGSQEVDMDYRTIIILPDGARVDSASIGCRVASIPIVASVVAAGDLPVAPPDTPWDENTAKANLADAAGGDEAAYARAFLFHDDTQQGLDSYYWPIADVIGGQVTVVPAAIEAAMAAIDNGTIGELTPDEKDATVAILTTYAPSPEDVPTPEAMMADMADRLSTMQARVNAFDEFMDSYLQSRIAAIVADEQPLPLAPEASLPVA